MDNPIGVLREEHEKILEILNLVEQTADDIENGASVDPQLLADILEFIRLFADQCHHGKEEDLLFPALAKKGFPTDAGPIGVMMMEHERGRAYVAEMSEAMNRCVERDPSAPRDWVDAAHRYVELLQNHIAKENNILFVMAERMLDARELRDLETAFGKAELPSVGNATQSRLAERLGKLRAKAAWPLAPVK